MKDINIVTFQNAYNYGAILQCYALQTILSSKKENDVKVLNYNNILISNVYKTFYKPQGKLKSLKYIKSFIKGVMYAKQTVPRNYKFKKFINNNIHLTKSMTREEIIKTNYDNNTTFVVGSDQVWNTDITGGYDPVYMLDFAPNARKISYAASIGKNTLDSQYIEQIKNVLEKYSAISVREKTAKEELEKYTKKEIIVTLDPTLLLEKKEWESSVSQIKLSYKNYIFVYMPNKECIEIAKNIQEKTNKKILYIDKKILFKHNSINISNADPFDFISYIKNADYVVTTSFHATIFSIIFNKKLWIALPNKVGSRITDLLEKLKMKNRCVNTFKEFATKKFDDEIDYTKVNEILNKERQKSKEWLFKEI